MVSASALILTCDRVSELEQTLDGLRNQTTAPSQYVIVNNSADASPTRRVIEQFAGTVHDRVVYLRGDPVFGTASGRNAALDECTEEITFLLDDDLSFPDDAYLERVADVFASDSAGTVGAVTTRASPPSTPRLGLLLASALRRTLKTIYWMDGGRPGAVKRSGFQVPLPSTGRRDVQWLLGGATALRRGVVQSIRFDEGLELRPFAVSEDIEFALQLRRRWRIVFDASTYAVNGHQRRGGTGRQWLDLAGRYELIVRNYSRINQRHMPGRLNRLAYWWAMAGIGGERLAALASRRHDAVPGWRGYVRGVRAVQGHAPGAPNPKRVVHREYFGGSGVLHTGPER